MAPPTELPERRKRENHALRLLYERVADLESQVDSLRKINSVQDKSVAVLEEKAVTKGWLVGAMLSLFVAAFVGARSLSKDVEESAQKIATAQTATLATQAAKLDRFIEAQASTNIKTEALYLLSVERKPREEVRAVVLQTAKEK